MNNKKETVLPGQTSININEALTAPTSMPTVKPMMPTAPKKNYVPGETLTEEDRNKMTATELENYEGEKDAAFLQKAKEESKRVKELRRKKKLQNTLAEEISVEGLDEHEDDICDDEFSSKISSSKTKQSNICRKFGIKRRELRRGVELARELFVPKMFSREKQKVILAIIHLLEFGDI
jgi:hypothetical protein